MAHVVGPDVSLQDILEEKMVGKRRRGRVRLPQMMSNVSEEIDYNKKQVIWANAHETRDSISLISYANCLGLFPVISATIHSLNVHRSLKSRKIH